METCIEVQNVVKRFRDQVVLKNVSISFEKGKIHGIVGRNGSGKTVLFKCICGLMHPEEGVILVNGKRVGRDVDMPEDIGAIIEAPGFLPNYSGYKNLRFLANIRRKIGKEEILNVLKTVGLRCRFFGGDDAQCFCNNARFIEFTLHFAAAVLPKGCFLLCGKRQKRAHGNI